MNCLRTIAKVSPLLKVSVASLEIVLERQDSTYYGGELIAGHCLARLIEPLEVEKIKIKFCGQVKTYVETNKSRNVIEHERLFQQFFWPRDLMVLSPSLSPGTHKIEFHFLVPMNVPSTFEYTDSYIKYKVKASFGLTTACSTVTILTNPNVEIGLMLLPFSKRTEKRIGLLGGRLVALHCHLPRIGFTVGRRLTLGCQVTNCSHKAMRLKATLRQEIMLTAMGEQRLFHKKLSQLCGPHVPPDTDRAYELEFPVPDRLPIVHDSCNLIQLNYILDVYLDIPVAVDLHCRLPILLTYLDLAATGTPAVATPVEADTARVTVNAQPWSP